VASTRFLRLARRRGENDTAREARAPHLSALEQARIGGEVVLEVADHAHVANTSLAQTCRVGVGLRERGCEARERRPKQGVDARAALPAALAQARVGEQHRHTVPGCDCEQVGPDLGLHQDAGGGRDSAQEPVDGARRIERKPELAVALAKQRLAGSAAGRGAVREQEADAGPSARSASRSGAAARVSPSETAWIHSAPGARSLRRMPKRSPIAVA
jgi:hypothetical protein